MIFHGGWTSGDWTLDESGLWTAVSTDTQRLGYDAPCPVTFGDGKVQD